ncbi:hypothetical protein [Coralloluteibacterium stylophorae]|uniref:Uncharacterized protein n=1 Tax=Coralloluteibacterium stylophorae TaxID=1776034 RepID=A0A8J8AXA3_9GAMM|nr:hypothetical protein [Coralloluteibacterium stylophorae]MBS7457676.1 hypothetical protein [Coralloluteibacterium stylophorae]
MSRQQQTAVASTMREAFSKAARAAAPSSLQGEIKRTLKRGAGLRRRKTMWSVTRGGR